MSEVGPSISNEISSEVADSSDNLNLTFLRFKIMSHISSETPSIVVNSCETPSIFNDVIAAPGNAVNKVLLKPLPIVTA